MPDDLKGALTDTWERFRSLSYRAQRSLLGLGLALIAAIILSWRIMTPLILLALAVVSYLRLSRGDDSL